MAEPLAYEGSDLEALLVLHRYRDWILSEIRPYLGGRTAEIGAGIGAYTPALRETATAIDPVEPSELQQQRLVERFSGDPQIQVLKLSVEQWAAQTENESYDTVVMINVLEHVEDDKAVLRQIYRALRPGGHLVIFVPALMFLYSDLDRLVGHHRRYSRPELIGRSGAAGFRTERCCYFDLLGTLPWLLVNRLGGATRFSPAAARLYDSVGVPFTRRIERLFEPPFGKNLLLAATKA